jgi:hypothetical protein
MFDHRIEPTVAPLTFRSLVNSNAILSSFEDDSYRTSVNIFQQLAVKGRNNRIPVGNCGMSTVNLSQLLSCLGLTVQETTTLTATFTITKTVSSGYTTMTVAGCTPAGFPVLSCPNNYSSPPVTAPAATLGPNTETVRISRRFKNVFESV